MSITDRLSKTTLFEVQRKCIEQSYGKPGFGFLLEQGLGKSRTVLTEFSFLVEDGEAEILIIICPRPLRGAWRDEVQEIGLDYPVILVDSDKKTFKLLNEVGRRPVIVVLHYEQVLTHGSRIITAMLERRRKVYVALDESVRVKKHTSVIGDKIYLLMWAKERIQQGKKKSIISVVTRAKASFVRILSGTPAPQGPHDLWNQFRIIGAMEGTPYYAWRSLYCRMGGYMGKQILGSQNLDLMRERTGKFAFRAKKKDWTDLPDKINMPPHQVELTPEQRRAYLEVMHDFVLEFGPDDYMTVEMAITVKNKLQQIASGWVYDNDKQVREIVPLENNPKLQEAGNIIQSVEGKVIVFYFFKPTRAYLEQLAQSLGIGYVVLAGSDVIDGREKKLSDEEFDRRKKLFNTDDNIKVAFCQTDSVKEGHTLLGTETMPCSDTLFVENTYSLYARAQGEDRNHRHGQKYPVNYWDIVTSKEDKDIIRALQRKGNMQEAILSEFTAYRDAGDNGLHFEGE